MAKTYIEIEETIVKTKKLELSVGQVFGIDKPEYVLLHFPKRGYGLAPVLGSWCSGFVIFPSLEGIRATIENSELKYKGEITDFNLRRKL